MRTIVIVGAALAGLRAATALREQGHDGELTIVGDEPYPPYDRPPLSKDLRVVDLPHSGLRATWRLGRRAVRLDAGRRAVRLDDGSLLSGDGLVIATGAAARRWPGRLPPRGVFTLRGRDDALALRAALAPGRRLVVIGAGFLGGEIAAAAQRRGLTVTLVEAAGQPLQGALGTEVGGFIAGLHRDAGIELRTGRRLRALQGADRLTAVALDDGATVPADIAVLALGATPATEWLAGSGLLLDDGLRCDERLRVLRTDGSPEPGIVAAGDVVRWPHPLAGGGLITLGHWTNAVDQAAAAARTLLHPHDPRPYTGIPSFWSDLYGAKIRSVGLPALADQVRIAEFDAKARRLEAAYLRDGRLVGAVTVNRMARLAAYRRELHAGPSSAAPR